VRFLNRSQSDNPNMLFGLFLLILLSVFLGPNVLPRLLASISPIIDEALPCDWLRRGFDRANHQSLIGRAAQNALELEVRASPIPANSDGVLSIEIIVINRSLGTVPLLYNPDQVNISDNGSSGLGLIFDPGNIQGLNTGRADMPSYPEQNIRLLSPRQRCIHTFNIPVSQLDPLVRSGSAQVRAFYRINNAGAIPPAAGPTPIYPDQGLYVVANGYVESPPVPIVVQFSSQ
jgi:hypothetical protein